MLMEEDEVELQIKEELQDCEIIPDIFDSMEMEPSEIMQDAEIGNDTTSGEDDDDDHTRQGLRSVPQRYEILVEKAYQKVAEKRLLHHPKSRPLHKHDAFQHQMATDDGGPCFVCGSGALASRAQPRRRYAELTTLFKTLVMTTELRKKLGGTSVYADFATNVESCATCLTTIRDVYDLRQEIVTLQT
ncbi:hypothetical protein Fcan01_24573 [Folsomia candida]|uniref:Uncharacterized protein n=1 Tax=Folsomia candida TaxID=158441 RepID=A0A226D526_FOLCA|nr:hypothetical protein Fcan01_24573 [Folsomia candida]